TNQAGGSYAGLSTAPVIEHLKRLGITAVELMPAHYFTDDRHLLDKGLRNYWGYNSIGYFAPERRYGVLDPISEFKTMVKTLHSEGHEVVLGVVYIYTEHGRLMGHTDAIGC